MGTIRIHDLEACDSPKISQHSIPNSISYSPLINSYIYIYTYIHIYIYICICIFAVYVFSWINWRLINQSFRWMKPSFPIPGDESSGDLPSQAAGGRHGTWRATGGPVRHGGALRILLDRPGQAFRAALALELMVDLRGSLFGIQNGDVNLQK